MNFFTKRATAEIEPPEASAQDRLEQINRELVRVQVELREARQNIASYARTRPDPRMAICNNEVFVRIGAMTVDPFRQALEKKFDVILRRHDEILKKRADLLLEIGLIR
jgi:hypothetical protein